MGRRRERVRGARFSDCPFFIFHFSFFIRHNVIIQAIHMIPRSVAPILILLSLACSNAAAHPLYQGRLDVTIYADHIGVIAHVTQEEVVATNTATTPGAPPGPWAGTGSSAYEQHAAYLASHLHVLADGKELPAGVASITQPDDPMK